MNTLQWFNLLSFIFIASYAIYLFTHIVYSRIIFIKLGKKGANDPKLKDRFNSVLVNVLGQRKLFKDPKSGIMHFVMFYGFFILQLGAIELIAKGFITGYELPFGSAHKYFSLMQEWTVFLMLCAVVYAYYRRYIEKLKRLKRDLKAILVIVFLSTLTVSILLMLGFEKIMLGHESNFIYTPFSGVIATIFSGIGTTAGIILFNVFWWVHLLALFGFMVFVPQSKQVHELFASFNVFFKKVEPVGKLKTIDFEEEGVEEFGVGKIEDFTQRQLIDLYACAECGRCTNVCPASETGKTLSPMDLIVKMRDHLTEKGASITARTPWMPSFAFKNTKANQWAMQDTVSEAAATMEMGELIGDVITEEEIWACTTCRNCEDQCPVANEHVDKIIDLRRYLVLTKGKMDSDAQRAIQNIERQSNPWGLSHKKREKWREDRDDIFVPTVKELKKENKEFEFIFWVGSMNSYDDRSQKIAISMAKIMNKAGISFAILGNQENNSGDTPRRIGNEFLFQELVAKNIQTFEKYGVKKIITTDPHAYNTFKNEYPEFGFVGEVFHHTEVINLWIKEGKITPKYDVNEVITYHDSCYLGRYNEVYEPPREILKSIPGVRVIEMERNRENGMCCGAGGGMMWMEEKPEQQVNIARVEQALAVSPTMIASACPYCLTMVNDGVNAKEMGNNIQTLDIAEIVERSLYKV